MIKNKEAVMKKYYLTFGTSKQQFLQRGWLEVHAENFDNLVESLTEFFGEEKVWHENGCIKCSAVYEEEEFKKTDMFNLNDNLGHGLHFVLDGNWSYAFSMDVNGRFTIYKVPFGEGRELSCIEEAKDYIKRYFGQGSYVNQDIKYTYRDFKTGLFVL
jgi:hypothetical protein